MNTVLDPQRPTRNPLSLGRLAQDDRGKFSRGTLWRLIRRQRRWRSEGILLQETCYILDRVPLDIRMKAYEHVLPERIFTHPIPVLQMRSPNAALLLQVVDIMLTRTRDCLGLFLACKRVRNEALEPFLKHTTLIFMPEVKSATATFLKRCPHTSVP